MHSVEPGDQRPAPGSDEAAAADQLQIPPRARRMRAFWRSIPSSPRCKMCTSPFGGPGGAALRLLGKGPWPANPRYCRGCFKTLYERRAGAEIECTLLFIDIRGSTGLAESMPARDYRRLLDRFYASVTEVLIEHEAIVDKFVGDEVIGIFVPVLTGGEHARAAVDSAVEALKATGHETDAPWIPIGAGVNTGVAYVGAVGTADHVEFTALGDAVNVTARLASAAGAGEVLVSESAARAANMPVGAMEHRRLDLRGKSESTDVFVLTLAAHV
ncbi:MAG TPA: adenylate/guanylate cyclase domain-containing protein [Candidatus Limnocylindria bacterium]|nr:adenylate/guanylate cyclase domain-containing protein [Candidatus Limnocylindria bacterium]